MTCVHKYFLSPNQNYFGWDFSGASNLNELHLYMQEKFMIRYVYVSCDHVYIHSMHVCMWSCVAIPHFCMHRRLKNDVLDQLPSKTRQTVRFL